MRTKILTTLGVVALAGVASYWVTAGVPVAAADVGPQMTSIGPLTFGPDGVLFAADTQAATIYALELGDKASAALPGTQGVDAIDQKIAALLGTDAKEIIVTDLVVHPRTKNAYISVMRGQGTASKPALLRVDGAGKIEVVSFENLKHTKVALPNAPNAGTNPQRDPRQQSITDMAFTDGTPLHRRPLERRVRLEAARGEVPVRDCRQWHQRRDLPRQSRSARDPLAGLRVPAVLDQQHPAPGRRVPVHAAGEVPGGQPAARDQGGRHDDRGARQPQPADRHGALQEGRPRVPAHVEHRARRDEDPDRRVRQCDAPITQPVETETGGVAYETVAAMKGIEQLDLLDGSRTLALSRTDGGLNLVAVALP